MQRKLMMGAMTMVMAALAFNAYFLYGVHQKLDALKAQTSAPTNVPKSTPTIATASDAVRKEPDTRQAALASTTETRCDTPATSTPTIETHSAHYPQVLAFVQSILSSGALRASDHQQLRSEMASLTSNEHREISLSIGDAINRGDLKPQAGPFF